MLPANTQVWTAQDTGFFSLSLGDTLEQASDLVPLLQQTVEKAAAQNSQHALLAEGVAASVLLSRLALLDTQTGEAAGSAETVEELLAYKAGKL